MATLARVTGIWQELAEFYRFEPKKFIFGLLAGLIIFGLGLSFLLVKLGPIYAFMGLLAVPLGILISSRPAIGLILVVILIPLENFNQLNFGGISTFEVVFMLSLSFAVLNYLVFRKGEALFKDTQSWLIFALLVVVLVSNFIAFDSPRTLERTFRLIRNVALYFYAIFVIRTRRELQWLIWAFILSGAVSAVYGLYVYYFNPSLLLESSDKVARVIGTMEDPNEFAGAMLIRLMMALSLLNLEMKKFAKLLLIGVVLVLLFSIFLTGSRGGLLGTGLAFIAYAFFSRRRGYWLLILSVLALLGLLLMPPELQQRIGLVETTENVGNSTSRRTTYMLFGLEVIQENPILGIGLDSFSSAYAQSEYQYMGSDSDGRIAHNTYLEFLVGTGVLGFLIFTGLIAVSLNSSMIIGRDYQRDFIRLLGRGLFAGIVGYFTVAFFLSQQYEKTLWLLFAFVVLVQRFYKQTPAQRETA
jgi:O-antigen ligase